MDYDKLRTELALPAYASLTDAQVAESLNTANRPVTRTTIPAHEVLEATVVTEWAALSTAEKQRYALFVGAGDVNIAGTNTRAAFGAMFGAGTQTRANLIALQNGTPISRAAELGLEHVGPHHVTIARAGGNG